MFSQISNISVSDFFDTVLKTLRSARFPTGCIRIKICKKSKKATIGSTKTSCDADIALVPLECGIPATTVELKVVMIEVPATVVRIRTPEVPRRIEKIESKVSTVIYVEEAAEADCFSLFSE